MHFKENNVALQSESEGTTIALLRNSRAFGCVVDDGIIAAQNEGNPDADP